MRKLLTFCVITVMAVTCNLAHATPVIYTNQDSYLSTITSHAYTTVFEGFESADWNGTGWPGIADPLTTQGLTWSGDDHLTTIGSISMWHRSGSRGFYDLPGDNVQIIAPKLYAAGGWIAGYDTPIDFVINDTIIGEIDAPQGHAFLGVIDTAGFSSLSIIGTANYGIDDFTFATPEPTTIAILGLGTLLMR